MSVIANHGRIPVWNLLEGDAVVIEGLFATVHSHPMELMQGAYRIEFLVFEILENDEVSPQGEWIGTPRVFARVFEPGAELPFIQTTHVIKQEDL